MQTYHASITVKWHFSMPPSHLRSAKLQLLTVGGIAVHGIWCGQVGENYVAWAPLLKYDTALFNATIEAYKLKSIFETDEETKQRIKDAK